MRISPCMLERFLDDWRGERLPMRLQPTRPNTCTPHSPRPAKLCQALAAPRARPAGDIGVWASAAGA
eukprot:tig00000555_g2145.t1